MNGLALVEEHRARLEECLRSLTKQIGEIPIGVPGQFPYGWRKAAKGRTVWRILEELISQNLQYRSAELGLMNFSPADSEVGVYDFSFNFYKSETIYVNVKSAVQGRNPSKDDISKADKLISFYDNYYDANLFITTIEIVFLENPILIRLSNCYVVPVAWLSDVYVNPSNNGNLQSSKYKDIESAVRRTVPDFLAVLNQQLSVARAKKKRSLMEA